MQTQTERPNRRPKLYLPLALVEHARKAKAKPAFPLRPDLLRRTVAEMIG